MTRRHIYPQTVKAVAYLFFWCHPTSNAGQILEQWTHHPVLKDYRRPDKGVLTIWVEEFVAERNRALYRDRYIKI